MGWRDIEKVEPIHEAVRAQIARLERRYGMTSTEFLTRYHQGELGDAADSIERAGLRYAVVTAGLASVFPYHLQRQTAVNPPATETVRQTWAPCRLGARRGGEGGIRTHEEVAPLRDFQSRALGHYATSPSLSRVGGKPGTLTPPAFVWRRGWDSNPRGSSPAAFRERCHQPLGHLSIAQYSKRTPLR